MAGALALLKAVMAVSWVRSLPRRTNKRTQSATDENIIQFEGSILNGQTGFDGAFHLHWQAAPHVELHELHALPDVMLQQPVSFPET